MTTETGPVATGLLKEVRLASETTWGTAAAAGGSSQKLRRVASTISLDKATYRSNEIQPDRQVHDFRHGQRMVKGQIQGELSPLTYESVLAQVMYSTFITGVTMTASTATTAAVINSSPAILVRATGSFVTDGFKIGDVVRISGSAQGANNARNLRITGIIQTTNPNDTLQVGPSPTTAFPSVGNEALITHAAESITIAVVGKKCIQAAAGSATDASFSIEHWFSDVLISELYTGCRASRTQIQLPPTGLGRIDFDVMGKDCLINQAGAGVQYFSAASAVTTSALTAAVNGLMRVGGVDYAIVTGLNFTINPGYTPEAVVGSNVTPYLFPGILDITGQFTALYLDEVLPNAFLNETEISLEVMLTLTSAVNSDFLNFFFPRIKLTSDNADDKPGAIVRSYGFQALTQTAGGAAATSDATTLMIQDSLAT